MKVVEKPKDQELSGWFGYLSPWKIIQVPGYVWQAVSQIFYSSQVESPRHFSRDVVVIKPDEDEHKNNWEAVDGYFELSTRPYVTERFLLNEGFALDVAKYFFTDMERIGNPDEFWIDEVKVQGPILTLEQRKALLEQMLEIAGGNHEKVTIWTKIWNHRPKIALCDQIKKVLLHNQELNPQKLIAIIKPEGIEKVCSHLNTKEGLLTTEIEGHIEWGSDDLGNLFKLPVHFNAQMTFDEIGVTVEFCVTHISGR